MTRPLKVKGLDELHRLARRAKTQFALGRISEPDLRYLLEHAKAIEARIVGMREEDESGKEVQIG